ncbi:unnamed protein product [Chironomus riparius]|uniref:EGF-like domain-containing protein n=1 Tax=Chironomus riparius TaxID=315576 RepID=A0A9N9RLR5_9DIPT|nr:unnamed protein product [Chironomus riparius]
MLDKQILLLISVCSIQVLALVKANNNKNIPKWKKQACEVPQQNEYFHYKCDENGDLKCLPGWQGDLCDVPICRQKCDPQNGYCKRPFECRCKLGFYGENCEQCIPLPGCQNGICHNPFECKCVKGWRGVFCNEPICREDCHPTHGYCENAGECKCRIGWTGKNCRDCQILPGCMHGTCTNPFECQCLPGWTGFLCDRAICNLNCNKQSGYCTKPGTCRCKVGWIGNNCSECHPYPGCKNGNCTRPWECNCHPRWGGLLCDEELNYCEKNRDVCQHGTCKSLPKDDGNFECSCMPGYFGQRCDRKTATSISRIEVMPTFPMRETSSQKPLLSERNTTTPIAILPTELSLIHEGTDKNIDNET